MFQAKNHTPNSRKPEGLVEKMDKFQSISDDARLMVEALGHGGEALAGRFAD